MKKFVTRPEIFCLLTLVYFFIGVVAIFDPCLKQVNPTLSIHPLTVFVWFFGLFCFLLGIKYSHLLFKLKKIPLLIVSISSFLSLHYLFELGWFISFLSVLSIILGSWIFFNMKKGFIYFFIIGLFAQVINLFLIGIPILNPSLHYDVFTIFNPVFVSGFFSMLFSLLRMYPSNPKIYRFYFIPVVFFGILSTFRGIVGLAILTWVFLELKNPKNHKKVLFVFLFLVLSLVLFTYMGYLVRFIKGTWGLNPLRLMEYRVGFTLHIFDKIVERSFPFGYSFGKAIVEPGKYICKEIFNCDSRLTSTVFGQSMLDFGLIGIFVLMFFFGGILERLQKIDYPVYSFLMSMLIVAIDSSTHLIKIIAFTYLGYMRVEKWMSKKGV